MCFSIQAASDLKRVSSTMNAGFDRLSYNQFKAMQELESKLGADEIKKQLNLKRKPSGSYFKGPDELGRIYPNYFTSVITSQEKKRLISPMRYRIRPNGSSEEIPTKFNVFNARVDSLEKRKTWSPLFMRNHGIVCFDAFYEWVLKDNKKTLIKFKPTNNEFMWAPCLWDEWQSTDGSVKFKSFAIITTDPPNEVEIMGHDRCPIFLNHEYIDDWLNPRDLNPSDAYEILAAQENEKFSYEWPS
ncbi:SOS response-associated peptidase family protein [Halobacteriovorax sp.]|uniref:SOS response-associated peptidase family protein n=1 Tax=Halobacteriovorax sp. TaxID=2020862 RepID=UPI003AF296BD